LINLQLVEDQNIGPAATFKRRDDARDVLELGEDVGAGLARWTELLEACQTIGVEQVFDIVRDDGEWPRERQRAASDDEDQSTEQTAHRSTPVLRRAKATTTTPTKNLPAPRGHREVEL
jgi:hypothetical protein